MVSVKRSIAAITASVAWCSLALQFGLMLGTQSIGEALWRFLGFFTVLTNILVAIMATGLAVGLKGQISSSAKARMAVTAGIMLVGLAYWTLLASLWQPEGWQLIADIGLHTAVPLLAFATWFASRDGSLRWRDTQSAALWPAAYAMYALARGSIDGWYAYWFFDPSTRDWGEILLSVVALATLVVGIGALLVAVDRRVPR